MRNLPWKIWLLIIILCGGIILWFILPSLSPAVDDSQFLDQSTFETDTAISSQDVGDTEDDSEDSAVTQDATGHFRLEIHTDNVSIESDVTRGVTHEDLKSGVGRHVTTGYPNEESGNLVLTGHRWYPGSEPGYTIFEDLDKLEHGDRVSVFYEDKEYIYEVFEDKIVHADEVDILAQTDEPQLTLYTCTPKYTSLRRLVYVAKLVEVKDVV